MPPDAPIARRLGLGLAAVGRPAYHTIAHGADFPEGRSPEQLQRRTHTLLDEAFEAGIRYVDAARSYGRAEAFVRAWVDARRLRPEDFVVGSKWGYRYVGGWQIEAERHEVKDHSLGAFRAQRGESLAILGPHLSLYQVHSVTPESPALSDDALLDELAGLRDEGVRIGLTVSGARQAEVIRRSLDVERGGAPLFQAVQATWNLLEPSCEAALRDAHAAGRQVIVKEPLANGRLTPRGDAGTRGPLAEVARRGGWSVDAVALAAALARPCADLVLLGASTVDQLRSNLAVLRLPLPSRDLATLEALREEPELYWANRASLRWT